MALWTDGKCLTLRLTEAKEYLFLEVRSDAPDDTAEKLERFMKLPHLKIIWHPEAKGWLLPVTLLPGINPFLEKFHEFARIRVRGRTADPARNRPSSDTTPRTAAAIFRIGHATFHLLVLLCPSTPKGVRELYYNTPIPLLKNKTTSDMFDDTEAYKGYLQLAYNFCETDGAVVTRGDILHHYSSPHDVYIADGGTFIGLTSVWEYDDLVEGVVPRQFKVPTQFGVMYWDGTIDTDEVWVDFDALADTMEYSIADTAPPDPEFENQSSERIVHESSAFYKWSSLSFDYPERGKKRYRIYFRYIEGGQEAPTYEHVLSWLTLKLPVHAYTDTTMVAHVGHWYAKRDIPELPSEFDEIARLIGAPSPLQYGEVVGPGSLSDAEHMAAFLRFGPLGDPGPRGSLGDPGPLGETGSPEFDEPVGVTGSTGPMGLTGSLGELGLEGRDGPDEASWSARRPSEQLPS
ncbi:Hypothetical protein POVN_LOCUS100 [uncultured virus]|nr:Hypothetical protein POVN_LOCUS100 [uncultured virus]